MSRTARLTLLALTLVLLCGCATLPRDAKRDPRDPWERMNRTTFKVNHALDKAIARPVAETYQKITPRLVRTGVSNFFDNLSYPVTVVSDLLQLKFKPFVQDTGRFLINSTAGIGGIFDPATSAGLPKNEEDLGLTLGHWGVKPGPYFVIPILGPSDVRDGVGRVGNIWLNPLHYVDNNYVVYSLAGVGLVDLRYRLLPLDAQLDQAYDPYALMRNAYLDRRAFLVEDGKLSDKERAEQEQKQYEEEQKIIEESGGENPPPEAPKPPK